MHNDKEENISKLVLAFSEIRGGVSEQGRVGAIESIRCRNPPVRQAAQLAFGAAPPAPSIGVDQ
ncbi:hypothetical protein T08_13305 [Trichinella sp. T8]|uniref:Uncharacterized protein n=1 Tax=Trichinella spiralis TaxID=6334 RepID=A0A0V1AWF9_TRISP|nr:hypothetical protein T01_13015 [Trichinella spiralis]KRZ93603.1 hypothetical protein T08_13305 [Trichinella sp. T8]